MTSSEAVAESSPQWNRGEVKRNPRSGCQHKAWGAAKRNPKYPSWKYSEPADRATDDRSRPGAIARGYCHSSRVYDPVTMLRTLTLTLSQWEREYPVASTTPSGLPAWEPRSAPGTDLIVTVRASYLHCTNSDYTDHCRIGCPPPRLWSAVLW